MKFEMTPRHRHLIDQMKREIKDRSHPDGELQHAHFVMYAVLRGKDVRKTSHEPEGDNALAILYTAKRKVQRESLPKHVSVGSPFDAILGFTGEDIPLMRELISYAFQKAGFLTPAPAAQPQTEAQS